MRISPDQLPRTLEKALAPAWLVIGDEPLLVGEAADAIRARARAAGHVSRETFFVDRYFDWSELQASSRSLSLFGERRILEVRMPSTRPGKDGGAVLAQLAADPVPDTLLLVLAGRAERDTYSTAWFRSFEKGGVVVRCQPVAIGQLPDWIVSRAARHGLSIEPEGAQLLAERVEGNLLAAHQEIEKLALLQAGGAVSTEQLLAAVADSARFNIFQLGEAALEGDALRSLRVLEGLRVEGVEPTLVLWALCRDLRALADARRNSGAAPGHGEQAERRAALLARALECKAGMPLGPLFLGAGRVDRQIKGLADGDPWTGMTSLVAAFAGIALPQAPAA